MDRKIVRDDPAEDRNGTEEDRLFVRMEQMNALLRDFNREALKDRSLPYIDLETLVHYRDIKLFLTDALSPLPMRAETRRELLAFAYRDSLQMKTEHSSVDSYALTLAYVRQFCYRTGNLDSADDYTIKIDTDILLPYKEAREKQWAGEKLTKSEEKLLDEHEKGILEHVDRTSDCAEVT